MTLQTMVLGHRVGVLNASIPKDRDDPKKEGKISGNSGSLSKGPGKNKGSLALKTLVFGLFSGFLYYLLFSNEQWVTTEYTKGGWHAVYPICTALIFSFVHGAFASNLLSLLGIEAKK